MKKLLLIIALIMISTRTFSDENQFSNKCDELGGDYSAIGAGIACHQVVHSYQDDDYNEMMAQLEGACLKSNSNDPNSFVVSDVWKLDGVEKYDVRSYCLCFDQDI